ncbi:YdcH family protein [Pseudomonas turukhanskensis]|jgi:uncharacterized protein YdcH (DUF465 family)|uniref:GTP-binding protein n=1 Tax=Pseudomonas turukhanskensis TaxID=1806536 RepID=A0A9W6KAH5_9PSED|nr:DUF465 domain-containing protein [Pseudomonas turukhanskensis]GLK91772.1 GTP-binding protein [Pseudomonas turukhanskensis]
MTLEHHPLHQEFPEFQGELQRLLGQDAHFSKLAADYSALDKQIFQVEDGRQAMDDMALKALKNERVKLNLEIARQLQAASKA